MPIAQVFRLNCGIRIRFLSVYLFVCLSIYLSEVFLSVYFPVYVCLSVWLVVTHYTSAANLMFRGFQAALLSLLLSSMESSVVICS